MDILEKRANGNTKLYQNLKIPNHSTYLETSWSMIEEKLHMTNKVLNFKLDHFSRRQVGENKINCANLETNRQWLGWWASSPLATKLALNTQKFKWFANI